MDSVPTFAIKPHEGIGPVKLGMTRTEVKEAFSEYLGARLEQAKDQTLDYAFQNSLQVEYDREGHVQFIGASPCRECGCEYTFRDRNIAAIPAREFFSLLASIDGRSDHKFDDCEYYFRNIRVTLYEADTQHDYLFNQTQEVYGQVGVANESYDNEDCS